MSMCKPCKTAADITQANRERGRSGGADMAPRHGCAYPHSCTCQHNRRPPVKPRGGSS